MKTLGQLAYEGYCKATGNKSLASGVTLPTWDQQDDKIKAAWEAAAEAVKKELIWNKPLRGGTGSVQEAAEKGFGMKGDGIHSWEESNG